MQEEQYGSRGLTINDLLFLIKKNIYMIIIITVIFTLVGVIYGFRIKKTTYTATANAIVMAESNETQQNGYQDYLYSNYLVNTFKEFILSDSVIELVIEELDEYDLEKKSIVDYTTVTSGINSLLIEITVKSTSEEKSIDLANSILKNAIKAANVKINDVYKYSVLAEKLVDMEYASESISTRGATTILIVSFLLGVIVSFAIILVKYLLNDTFTSKDEFERITKLNVLALLQLAEEGGKKNEN